MNEQKPYVWQMVKRAVEDLGGDTTNQQVRDWIWSRYPDTNPRTIACQIIVSTVNHASRVHYPENTKPRRCDGGSSYDFLYRPERGRLQWYDPEQHGVWALEENDEGRLVVQRLSAAAGADPPNDHGNGFAAEAHLRDYLARHLHEVEPGLGLYVDEQYDRDGVEYPTGVGVIDILAQDATGGFVVIELKVAKGPDSVAGQVLRYKNWVKAHLADGKPVRGVIIAQQINDKIRYAVAGDEEIALMEYEISLNLKSAEHVSSESTLGNG